MTTQAPSNKLNQESLPTLGKASFTCPHCGAIAHQTWYNLRPRFLDNDHAPNIPSPDILDRIEHESSIDDETKEKYRIHFTKLLGGKIFFDTADYANLQNEVGNLWISNCYSCKDTSVWVHDRLVYPAHKSVVVPNADLPDDIKADFVEAVEILDLSPRGSAALLRLCVQKLCRHLGRGGENLNADIAALVKDGLDERLQRSLDIVRVIGNNAVHPGQIDLTDDKETASRLFRLVNLIADRMITQPKQVDELYDDLPPTAREQIEKRDAKALSKRDT